MSSADVVALVVVLLAYDVALSMVSVCRNPGDIADEHD